MDAMTLAWSFLNSNIGLMCVGFVLSRVLIAVYKRHPEWQTLFEENRGLLIDAVKFAEANVPAGTPGSGAAKARAALEYVQGLDHPIKGSSETVLSRAIEAAHTVERGGVPALTPSSPEPVAAPAAPSRVVG